MAVDSCPTHDQLAGFSAGRLSDDQLDRLAAHVSTCEDCQSALTELDSASDDPLAGRLRDFGGERKAVAGASDIEQIVARFEQAALDSVSVVESQNSRWQNLPEHLGQYRVLEPLRSGGMGTVVKAEHTVLRRTVALKLLPPERFRDSRAVSRFRREIEAIAQLDHPNIVRGSDAGEQDGIHFLVMELVDGLDLSMIVRRYGPLPVAEACELVRQTALALQHAHEHGMVHRDIKPSNVMLDTAGQVKLLDLGLARLGSAAVVHGELTSTGQVLGTFDYMAPEQASDLRNVDIRADLYSLGCTFYHLLAGAAPFSGARYDTAVKKLMAHSQEPVVPIEEIRPDVPAELARVVARLLDKEPERRFTEPQELAVALEPLAAEADLGALLRDADAGRRSDVPLLEPSTARLAELALETPASAGRRGWSPRSGDRRPRRADSRRRRWVGLIALAAVLGGGAWWMIPAVIRIVTGTGTLEITPLDADVQIVVMQKGERVHVLDTKTNRAVELLAGRYELELDSDDDEDLRLSTDRFTLARGAVKLVDVNWVPQNRDAEESPPMVNLAPNVKDRWARGIDDPAKRPIPGLIPHPADLPGVGRWQIECANFRHGIRSAVWSPDGKYLACVSTENECSRLYILNVASRRMVRIFSGPGTVLAAAWSPDSKRIVGVGEQQLVQVWDIQQGKEIHRASGVSGEVGSLAWSPDGKLISIGGQRPPVWIWEPAKDQRVRGVHRYPGGGTRFLEFNTDGRLLYSATLDGRFAIWDTEQGSTTSEFQLPVDELRSIAISPDGSRLAAASSEEVRLFQLPKGEPGKQLELPSPSEIGSPETVAFSSDGRWIAVGTRFPPVRDRSPDYAVEWKQVSWSKFPRSGGRLLLLDAKTLEIAGTYDDQVTSVAFAPDSRRLAVVNELAENPLHVLSVEDPERLLQVEYVYGRGGRTAGGAATWSPNGKLMVVRGYRARAQILDAARLVPLRTLAAPGRPYHAWSPDSSVLAVRMNSKIDLWDVETGERIKRLPVGTTAIRGLSWDHINNRFAAIPRLSTELTVWDRDWTLLHTLGPGVERVNWSPDGRMLEWRNPDDASITVWDVERAQRVALLKPPSQRGCHFAAWSPDSRLIAGASALHAPIYVWNITTSELVATLSNVADQSVPSLGFSPDGRWLAACGHPRGDVLLWDTDDWSVHERLSPIWQGGHLTWSPDARFLAGLGWDGILRYWEPESGELAAIAVLINDGKVASFTAAGQTIHADPEAENELVYLVEEEDGRIDLLRPSEFLTRVSRR